VKQELDSLRAKIETTKSLIREKKLKIKGYINIIRVHADPFEDDYLKIKATGIKLYALDLEKEVDELKELMAKLDEYERVLL
jgi:hypothetical protein